MEQGGSQKIRIGLSIGLQPHKNLIAMYLLRGLHLAKKGDLGWGEMG
jgi:hypothetical protein